MNKPLVEQTLEQETLNAFELVVVPGRELARRVSGGIEITLYWNADDDSISVEVWQPATEQTLRFAVARELALEAFHHPFAHLPIELAEPIPAG